MSDLVVRLRLLASDFAPDTEHDEVLREAADEIERLREAIAKERERCAQVADDMIREGYDAAEIAAAIRALKI
jgi:hypothetical protein